MTCEESNPGCGCQASISVSPQGIQSPSPWPMASNATPGSDSQRRIRGAQEICAFAFGPVIALQAACKSIVSTPTSTPSGTKRLNSDRKPVTKTSSRFSRTLKFLMGTIVALAPLCAVAQNTGYAVTSVQPWNRPSATGVWATYEDAFVAIMSANPVCVSNGQGGCLPNTGPVCSSSGYPIAGQGDVHCYFTGSGAYAEEFASAVPCDYFAIVDTTDPCSAQACFHEPINAENGNVYKSQEDVQFVGAGAIAYSRYYSSNDGSGVDGVPGWRHSYSRSIAALTQLPIATYPPSNGLVSPEYSSPEAACISGFAYLQPSVPGWANAEASYTGNTCVVSSGSTVLGTLQIEKNSNQTPAATPLEYDAIRDNGETLRFTLQTGTPAAQPGQTLRFAVTGAGFTVTDDDDNVETYNTAGVLQSVTSRSGVVQTVQYDGTGLFSGVTDSFGHTISVTRNTAGSIATLAVAGGGSVQYGYDGENRLTSVVKLDGNTLGYVYGDTRFANALTAEIDEYGVTYSTWTYDSQERGVATQEALGAGAGVLSYNSDGTVTDTDALGAVRTVSFTRIGDDNRVTSISGSQCPTCQEPAATTYDAAGFVSSRTDYNGNVTCYANDPARGLELVRVEGFAPGSTCPGNLSSYTPAANTSQRKIATAWDANFREPDSITQAGRITTLTYDSSGNPLTKTVTDTTVSPNVSRTWSYSYNSYGQVLTARGPRTERQRDDDVRILFVCDRF